MLGIQEYFSVKRECKSLVAKNRVNIQKMMLEDMNRRHILRFVILKCRVGAGQVDDSMV